MAARLKFTGLLKWGVALYCECYFVTFGLDRSRTCLVIMLV